MYGQQNSGPINGLDPLVYTGSLPNLVINDHRPNIGNIDYNLGTFWLIPEVNSNDEAELWILAGKFNKRATWKRVFDTSGVDDNQLIKYTILNTPGSGVFNFHSRMLSVKVECIGGGGSSATLSSLYNGSVIFTVGGAAGGYTMDIFNRSQVGSSQQYTVGAGGLANMNPGNFDGQNGGTTTFGSPVLLTATGGSKSYASVAPNFGSLLDGGVGSGGKLNQIGGSSIFEFLYINDGNPNSATIYTYGGNSFYGDNPAGPAFDNEDGYAVAGVNGSGASGVMISNAVGHVGYGANGGDGLIIITEYLG